MPAIKNAPSIAQFVNDVKNLMLEIAARATAIAGFARIQSDTFKDATGINAGTSSGYSVRGTPNFDVILNPGGIRESATTEDDLIEIFSNIAGSERGAGQSFTASAAYTLASVTVKMIKLGSPTGNLRLAIYAVSGDLPTGGALATSPDLNVATIAGAYTEYTFTLSVPLALSNGTKYFLAIERNGAYTGDGANHINIRLASSSVYAGGVAGQKSNTDTWAGVAKDLYFKTNEAASSSADIRQVTLTLPSATTQVILFADVTLGSGTATYYVSSDNGGTWTTVTLAQMGQIISVPSGTQLVARVVLTGNAELEHLSIASAA